MLCRIGTRTIKNFFKTAGTSSVPKLQGSGWCSGFSRAVSFARTIVVLFNPHSSLCCDKVIDNNTDM